MRCCKRWALTASPFLLAALIFALLCTLPLPPWGGAAFAPVLAASKAIVWKPVEQPLLRVDDRPVVQWNVYQAGKKLNPLLLEMNGRYLLIDQQQETVYEVTAAKITKKGGAVYWDPADRPAKPLETSGWIIKDVGSAYRVRMKLVAEGHVLDLQISHPMDLRPITPF